jgi:hypothetical protein
LPIDLHKVAARTRSVDIPELGLLTFREPTLADVTQAVSNPFWWVACITCQDGSAFLQNPQDAGKIRADIAGRLLEEVNRQRPTDAPSEGSGASQVPSNA